MIVAIAIGSLFAAAADDVDPPDALSRFHFFRGIGDLEEAYSLLLSRLGPYDKGRVFERLEQWIQASGNLEELKERLIEYQGAWASCVLNENSRSMFRFHWPLYLQFENTFLSSGDPYPLTDFGIPWFSSDSSSLKEGRSSRQTYQDLDDPDAPYKTTLAVREYRMPNWPSFINGRRIVKVSGRRALLWSIDDRDALVGLVAHREDEPPPDRILFRFLIVPQSEVKVQ